MRRGRHWGVMSRGPGRLGFAKAYLAPVFRTYGRETVVDSGPLIGGCWSNSRTRGLRLRDCHGEKWEVVEWRVDIFTYALEVSYVRNRGIKDDKFLLWGSWRQPLIKRDCGRSRLCSGKRELEVCFGLSLRCLWTIRWKNCGQLDEQIFGPGDGKFRDANLGIIGV